MSRHRLVPPEQVEAYLTLAQRLGIPLAKCGLDVGRDYVRLIPPSEGSDSLADYIGDTHRPKKAGAR